MADVRPRTSGVRFELEPPPAPAVQWRELLPFLPIVVGCLAAAALYWPALSAPLVSDDYIYFRAAKTMSWSNYAHAALVPHSNDPVLALTRSFWRPLYFLSFKALWPVFGGHVVAYHILLLGIHFAGIVMVWLLARRLTRRDAVAGAAALIFAVHPAGFLAVAWISYLNSASVPLAIGAFLAFGAAVEAAGAAARRRRIAGSLALVTLAILFRETAIAIVPIMTLWYVLVPARSRLLESRTYLVLIPFAVFVVAFQMLRTRFFTEPSAPVGFYEWNSGVPKNLWYLVKLGFGPFEGDVGGWRLAWARAGGIGVTGGLVLALACRRWLLVALIAGFVVALLPFAPVRFGLAPRYFYFGSAFFALALAVALVELYDFARRVLPPSAAVMGGALLLSVGVVGGVVVGNRRTATWAEGDPAVHQRWVDELRASVPELAPGATLYCANTPLVIALFDAAVLEPTVAYYYPDVGHAVRVEPQDVARTQLEMKPGDRVFVYR